MAQPPLVMDHKTVNNTGEQFQRLFYDAMDRRRHMLHKFYLDNGVLCWNGHAFNTTAAIAEFYSTLAQTSHQVNTLDTILMPSAAVGDQKAVVVHVSGYIRLDTDTTSINKPFTESFILTHIEDKWRIVSDIFRTQNAIGALTL